MDERQRDWLISAVEQAAHHDSVAGERVLAQVRQGLFELSDQPPTTLDRFHLLEVQGRGATGAVYAAYDPKLDRKIALKILGRGLAHAERVRREARAAAALNHPNVVTVHDFGESDGRAWVAMEFVAGRSLTDSLGQLPRPWSEVRAPFLAAAEGLSAAHQAGIVHRDFKPDNVLVGEDGRVRVADFGLAVSASEGAGDAPGIAGTPAYMAPEQLRGEAADARSDQFSFCVALFEALHGTRPFAGRTLHDVLSAIRRGLDEQPRPDGVPAYVERALATGLSFDAAARHSDMRALIDAMGPAPPGRRWGLAVATLGVVGLATAAAVSLPETEPPACAGAGEEITELWNPASRPELATPPAWSKRAVDWTLDRFDAYATRWAEQSTSACEATRVVRSQSESELAVRRRCLEQAKSTFGAAVEALVAAGEDEIVLAHQLVDVLPELAACEDVAELQRRPLADTSDPQLQQARALERLGKLQPAAALMREVVERASANEDRSTEAAARIELGRIEADLGTADALTTLQAGLWLAHAQGLSEIAVGAAVSLILHDVEAGRPDRAARWLAYADAEVDRAGAATSNRVRLLAAKGFLAMHMEAHDEAMVHFEAARQLQDRSGASHRAFVSQGLASAMRALGRFDEAIEIGRGAVAELDEQLGAAVVTGTALVSLSNTYGEAGRFGDQVAALTRARAIFDVVAGKRSPPVMRLLLNLGGAYRSLRQLDDAEAALREAAEMAAELPGERPVEWAASAQLATVLLVRKEPEDAEALLRAAIAGADAAEEEYPELRRFMGAMLGWALEEQGKHEEARDLQLVQLAKLRALEAPPSAGLLSVLTALGRSQTNLGAVEEAIMLLEEARSLASRTLPAGHLDALKVELGLGRALRHAGRTDEAVPILDAALQAAASLDTDTLADELRRELELSRG